jgi:hypothetical protein
MRKYGQKWAVNWENGYYIILFVNVSVQAEYWGKLYLRVCNILFNLIQLRNFGFDFILRCDIYGNVISISISISISTQMFFTVGHYSGDKMKKIDEDRACSTYGGQDSCPTWFWWGNLRERDLENSGLDGGEH